MTQKTQIKKTDELITATVACAFEIAPGADGAVPTEAHLLPSGHFRATDGRPYSCPSWFIDATVAAAVIARMAARANDTLIDYNHQSVDDYYEDVALAAGWFKTMEFREAGLYAVGISWTPKGAKRILNKELRYISAVFTYYESTGEVLDVISIALTNTPALDGLDALAALNKKNSTLNHKEPIMDPTAIAALTTERDTLKTQAAALTAERDSLTTQVAALTTEKSALTTKVAALELEKITAAEADEKQQCADLLQAALTSGKVLPMHKAYLSKKNLAELKDYLEHIAGVPLALLTKQHTKDEGDNSINDDPEAIANKATEYQVSQAALGLIVDDAAAVMHVTKGLRHV